MRGSVPDMLNTTLASRRRAELGLTLEQVAARVSTRGGGGTTRQSIHDWETGRREPVNTAKLRAYAAALELPVADLVAEPEPEVAATP